MPEPFPPQTWPEGAIPTVDQLRAWIKTFEDHHDARIAADMIAGELGRVRIELERYQSAIRGANAAYARLEDRMARYRFAWLSARRRARFETMQHAAALEGLTMVMAENRRNRLAWLSARARARGYRNAGVRLAREVAPLTAWSDDVTRQARADLERHYAPREG